MCHNPHTDMKPKDALKSCADAQMPRQLAGCRLPCRCRAPQGGRACETCHAPHAARVDASDCTGCHESVRKSGGKLRPPMPFDTTKALQQSFRLIEPGRSRVKGRAAAGRSPRAAMGPTRRPRRHVLPSAPSPTRLHHLPHDHRRRRASSRSSRPGGARSATTSGRPRASARPATSRPSCPRRSRSRWRCRSRGSLPLAAGPLRARETRRPGLREVPHRRE